MTSHLHPAINPTSASLREWHQRQADILEQYALKHEQRAAALRSCIDYPKAKLAQQHAAEGRRYRRAVRCHLAAATALTDWRDDIDRKPDSWCHAMQVLYRSTTPAHERRQAA